MKTDACLSDLRIDLVLAGESAGDDVHVATCTRCQARLAHVREAQRYAATVLPPLIVPVLNRRRPVRAQLALVGLFAAASVAVIVALGPLRHARPTEDTRLKGHSSLTVYVQREGEMREVTSGGAVYPNDQLQFAYTAARDTYLGILSIDAEHRASISVPRAAAAQWVPRGVKAATSNSVVLDDVLGTEQFFALFCEGPVDLVPLREALASRGTLDPPSGCEVDTVALEKVAAP